MIEDEWFILGYFDVADRPNTEVIYQADNPSDALAVYNKIVASFEEDCPQQLKDELMNDYGVVDLWEFGNNFQLLSIYKARKWEL